LGWVGVRVRRLGLGIPCLVGEAVIIAIAYAPGLGVAGLRLGLGVGVGLGVRG
jgi:hypothetical protein